MASYVGSKIVLTANDGVYIGTIHSMDENNSRITLDKVVAKESGSKLSGLLHFFGKDIIDINIIHGTTKKREVQEEDRGPTLMRRKLNPQHLKNLRDIDHSELTLKQRHKKISGYNSVGSNNSSEDDNQDIPPSGRAFSDNDTIIKSSTKASRLSKYVSNQQPQKTERIENNVSKQLKPAEFNVPKSTSEYTILDQFGDLFTKAIEHIKQQKFIGLALEGVGVGRKGKLCWLQIGCPGHVFLFDVIQLGAKVFTSGLGEILQDGNIQKIVHDCRFPSDMLYHQYKIKLLNVFDTQVAAVMVYKLFHGGDLPRYVHGVHAYLFEHMNLNENQVFIQRARESSFKEDMAVWAERPVSEPIVDAAVKNVCYLRELRTILHQKMLTDFIDGVDIYLSLIRDLAQTDEDQPLQRHILPLEFRDIRSCAEERRLRFLRFTKDENVYDEKGFRENCPGVLDPLVKYSHDGCWHAGTGTVNRIPSPDPLSFTRRGRARNSDHRRSRSGSRGRPKEDIPVMALGSAQLRKQNMTDLDPTSTRYTEALAPEPDLEKVMGMKYVETNDSLRHERSKPMENGLDRSPEGQQSGSSVNGGRSQKPFKVIAAGAESTGGVPKLSERKPESQSALSGTYNPNQHLDYEENFDVIPGSDDAKKQFKEKPVFSSTVKNRLPRCALQAGENRSAFTRVAPQNGTGYASDSSNSSTLVNYGSVSDNRRNPNQYSALSGLPNTSPPKPNELSGNNNNQKSSLLTRIMNSDSDSSDNKTVPTLGRGRGGYLDQMLKSLKVGSPSSNQNGRPSAGGDASSSPGTSMAGVNKEQFSDSDRDGPSVGIGRARTLHKYADR